MSTGLPYAWNLNYIIVKIANHVKQFWHSSNKNIPHGVDGPMLDCGKMEEPNIFFLNKYLNACKLFSHIIFHWQDTNKAVHQIDSGSTTVYPFQSHVAIKLGSMTFLVIKFAFSKLNYAFSSYKFAFWNCNYAFF